MVTSYEAREGARLVALIERLRAQLRTPPERPAPEPPTKEPPHGR